jgi:hypothetical protein
MALCSEHIARLVHSPGNIRGIYMITVTGLMSESGRPVIEYPLP